MVRMTSVGDDDHVGSKNNNSNNNNTTPNKSTPTNPPSRPLIPGCTFPTPGGYFLTCHFDPIALRQNNPTLGTPLLLPTPLSLTCIPPSNIYPLSLISTPPTPLELHYEDMYGLVSPLNYLPAQVHTKLLVFPASAEVDPNNRGKTVRLLWHDPAPIGNNYP